LWFAVDSAKSTFYSAGGRNTTDATVLPADGIPQYTFQPQIGERAKAIAKKLPLDEVATAKPGAKPACSVATAARPAVSALAKQGPPAADSHTPRWIQVEARLKLKIRNRVGRSSDGDLGRGQLGLKRAFDLFHPDPKTKEINKDTFQQLLCTMGERNDPVALPVEPGPDTCVAAPQP
jgi:hypothetical protein